MYLLTSWLILTVSMYLTAVILPGVHLKSFGRTFVVAAIYGGLNLLLGWLLWTVLAIGTLGLALLLAFITRIVVNAVLLSITDAISDTLKIDSFGWALGGAALMSVLMTVGERLVAGIF
jgi:putative membrane protein